MKDGTAAARASEATAGFFLPELGRFSSTKTPSKVRSAKLSIEEPRKLSIDTDDRRLQTLNVAFKGNGEGSIVFADIGARHLRRPAWQRVRGQRVTENRAHHQRHRNFPTSHIHLLSLTDPRLPGARGPAFSKGRI